MNYRIVALPLIVTLLGITGCFWYSKEQRALGSIILVNVLDADSYADCHIKGSINVPFAEVENYFAHGFDKEKSEIVLYCSNMLCSASSMACQKLMALGFKKVWVYEAGIAEWFQQGLPVEGACASSYLTNVVSVNKQGADGCNVLTTQQLVQKMSAMVQ